MSDEPQSDPQALALVDQNLDNRRSGYKNYSDEDRYTALAALDINGGNVYRTAIAYNIPYSTLRAWAQEREAHGAGPSKLEKERRGNLAAKLESKLHDVIESITPEVIKKATLSQRGVFFGIGHDKLSTMQRNVEPDPAVELARILGCSVKQLPATLQLEPGEEIPEGFGPIIDVTAKPVETTENRAQGGDERTTEEASKVLNLPGDH